MHRQRIYRSTNAIHPKFVARVSCMHTTHLDVVLLIYKASSRLQRHFCMWHVASTNQNHVHFCGLVVSLWFWAEPRNFFHFQHMQHDFSDKNPRSS